MKKWALLTLGIICYVLPLQAQKGASFEQKEVIYGRKDGMALTMFVMKPSAKSNQRAIIHVVSGGWSSDQSWMNYYVNDSKPFIERGYTVFAVVHGSQPRYTIPDAVADVQRAVRFIRHNANEYKIDPNKIGITGSSAGGHLSLMMATMSDDRSTNVKDAVDRASARVQAVACFYPPTDFLNFGQTGANLLQYKPVLAKRNLLAPFLFTQWDTASRYFAVVSDTARQHSIAKQMSPVNHISSDDAPVLIIHGDADKTVPLQQSQLIISRLEQANVPSKLIVRKGADHGWSGMNADRKEFVDWFDRYLK
ncbi:MAG TPA: alpha/beta fold hydrolase [Chitinophagaceae bacterium]|nr:alpha/beta fold hydrolase [Chitinophagaceae bacterium]